MEQSQQPSNSLILLHSQKVYYKITTYNHIILPLIFTFLFPTSFQSNSYFHEHPESSPSQIPPLLTFCFHIYTHSDLSVFLFINFHTNSFHTSLPDSHYILLFILFLIHCCFNSIIPALSIGLVYLPLRNHILIFRHHLMLLPPRPHMLDITEFHPFFHLIIKRPKLFFPIIVVLLNSQSSFL